MSPSIVLGLKQTKLNPRINTTDTLYNTGLIQLHNITTLCLFEYVDEYFSIISMHLIVTDISWK